MTITKPLSLERLLEEFKEDLTLVNATPLSHQLAITGITSSSKLVQPGYLFIAEKGIANDGHKYLPIAVEKGAVALLVERLDAIPQGYNGLVLKAQNTRLLSPQIASLFFNKPSEKLFCVGVTGTNGKTSITHLIEHFFNAAKMPTGVIGTIDHHLGSKIWHTEMTTPHPIELQSRLNDFVQSKARVLAIEVSSHAISQKRVEGIEFDVGIYTNLTRDHLDYHSTIEEYFEVKELLFSQILGQSTKNNLYAIINRDDPWGKRIQPHPRTTQWTYGMDKNKQNLSNDFSFAINKMSFSGAEFTLQTPMGSANINSPLIGLHNVYNVVAAMAAGIAGGLSLHSMAAVLPQFNGIPGRLQRVPNSHDKFVFIDYAHSPDALENVLLALQNLFHQFAIKGRILCVFGCGGDRDKGKRPLMAAVAEKYSDIIVVTSDNPRTEDPLKIINDIKVGFQGNHSRPLIIEPDRQKAIAFALQEAQPNDVVLIAGKGHEDYQIIGKEKFYFSDYEVARKLLA